MWWLCYFTTAKQWSFLIPNSWYCVFWPFQSFIIYGTGEEYLRWFRSAYLFSSPESANSVGPRLTKALALQYGCLSPPRLENQRPFGIDRLEQIFRANNESRLMELFLFHFRQTGHTLEQAFLGTTAFATVDPANLEAILSGSFKGQLYLCWMQLSDISDYE